MIRFFDAEDPFEAIAAAKEEADKRILPWQAQLKKGDYFYYFSSEAEIVVWGEVLEDQIDPEMHGYRFCRCYSPIMPEGELGDVHVSVIHSRVSEVDFKLARATGWPHDEESFTRFAAQVVAKRKSN